MPPGAVRTPAFSLLRHCVPLLLLLLLLMMMMMTMMLVLGSVGGE